MLKNLILGDAGLRFVLASLEGGGTFCQLARKAILGCEGVCFAHVHEDVGQERALKFEAGGLPHGRMPFGWFANRVISFCRKDQDGVLVLEDLVSRRSDSRFFEKSAKAFYFEEEVYYFVECQSADANDVDEAFRDVNSFRSVSFLIDACDGLELEDDRSVDVATLSLLAKNISEIFIVAYDQEGAVVWSRSPMGHLTPA
ncbi:MAG: hypothetical protein JSR47_24985 [Proteobacteria bacterium]|nr:hypothetical protein [Pseudomonadota bacterium]